MLGRVELRGTKHLSDPGCCSFLNLDFERFPHYPTCRQLYIHMLDLCIFSSMCDAGCELISLSSGEKHSTL